MIIVEIRQTTSSEGLTHIPFDWIHPPPVLLIQQLEFLQSDMAIMVPVQVVEQRFDIVE